MADNFDIYAESQMIELPAGRFHYLSWSADKIELPGIVLLHGITSSAQSWIRVGPALADRYRVYALDQRGHGKSIKPSHGAYGLRQTADDALAFIQALHLEHPALIGHSWGGATSIILASGTYSEQAPPVLSSIVLEDPAYNFGSGGNLEERAASYTKDIGRSADELRPEIAASNPGWTEADIEGKIEALQDVTREAVLSVFAEAGTSGDLLPLLAKITSPTLLMRADPKLGSLFDDATWERAKHYLPQNSHTAQVDGASHNIHRSTFDAFMNITNAHLQS